MKCLTCIHLREITNGKRTIFCRKNLWTGSRGRVTISSLKLLKKGSWLDKVIPPDCPFYEDEDTRGIAYEHIERIGKLREQVEIEELINEKTHR